MICLAPRWRSRVTRQWSEPHGEDSAAVGVNGNQNDNSAPGAGAAYVFVRSGGTWSQRAYFKASNTGAGDNFGIGVAISADTALIGAWAEDSSATGVNGNQNDNSFTNSGAVYVFNGLPATARLETEALKVQAVSPVPSGYSTAQWYGVFNAAAASHGAGTYFNANAIGNYITYTVPVAKPGTYHLRVGIQTKPNKGIWRLAINGLNIGQPQDEYYPSVSYGVRDLGAATFSVAGNYAFKFTVAGKNASSTGYTLAFDYIELVPNQP